MDEIETRIVSKAIARVSRKPETSRTAAGFPVCRVTVATTAQRPGENPVIMPIYVFGGPSEAQRKLAERCAGLRVGELVQATGFQRQRVRVTKGVNGKHWRENALQALDVQLLGEDGRPVKRPAAEREGLQRGLVVNLRQS